MDKNAYFQKKKNNGNSTDDGDEINLNIDLIYIKLVFSKPLGLLENIEIVYIRRQKYKLAMKNILSLKKKECIRL